MNTTDRTDTGDPEDATQQYESLRANALGEFNQAPNLTLFLRDGMSAWLCALGAPGSVRRTIYREPSPVIAGTASNMPGAELASILADAILNTAGSVGHFGGKQ
ncbi:MAG: hypothetical protein E4H01_16745 [Lysobacterales bacterium]|nr:MAG: hypothetical protein E4H01_16745 [Xanthomonadales bacterium]